MDKGIVMSKWYYKRILKPRKIFLFWCIMIGRLLYRLKVSNSTLDKYSEWVSKHYYKEVLK